MIFGASLLFQSCNKDEIIDFQEFKNNNIIVESVSLIEIENNALFSNIISNKTSKIDIYKSKSSNTSRDTNDYSILTDDISKASYKDYEAYSFRISNPNQPLFTFDNYVIQKNHDGTIEEFILRYEYDQLEYVKNNVKKLLYISKFDTDYNFISSNKEGYNGSSFSNKSSLSAKSSGGDCTVTTKIYHRIPDGREFEFTEGSVCQHPGECEIIIEYTIYCPPGGGGTSSGDGTGGGPDTGGGYVGDIPDNGGTNTPITTLQPPAGQVDGQNTIDVLTGIIEAPLSKIPSIGELNEKTSALIGYLLETNQPVFQDLSILLATNLYDSNLNVTDRTNLWLKSRAIYNIVKNNKPTSFTTFDMFFSGLDNKEQESYTKNTMETALFSSVKSIVGGFWPQNAEEWGVLFKLMGPLLLEIGIEFLPGGGVFNAGKDTLAGLSSGDYTTAVIGVVGIIMEFVPWAKLAKIVSKVYDVGKSAFKIFKVAYNFLGSIATAIEHGIKTVLDGSGILKLIDNSGNQVGRIVYNVMEVSKHGIKAVDGSVLFRTADDVNAEFIQAGLNAPYKLGKPVTEFVTSETEQFVRVFTEGATLPDGRWMVKASDIQGMTPAQIQDFLSLPNTPNKIVDVNIPSGIKMRTGEAGDVTQFGTNGGVTQFEIPYPDTFDPSWFSNIQNL